MVQELLHWQTNTPPPTNRRYWKQYFLYHAVTGRLVMIHLVETP